LQIVSSTEQCKSQQNSEKKIGLNNYISLTLKYKKRALKKLFWKEEKRSSQFWRVREKGAGEDDLKKQN